VNRFVIDASCVGPLVLPDEAENLLPVVRQALEERGCIAPGHWCFEVGNLALMAVRRKRAEALLVAANLADLSHFGVDTDHLSSGLAWTNTLSIAEETGLTLYDAAYLELARRLALPLLSMDGALLKAAAQLGVSTNSAS
jgi:predicted nucleic acid-binding protein